jgi:RNA polymerase sigma-B factor
MATISGEIKRHFRDRTWGVHVPRRLQDLSLAIGHGTTVLTNVLSRTPTTAELAAYLQTDEAEIAAAVESAAGYTPSSLNMPVGDGGGEIGDLMGSVDPGLALVDDRLTVARLLLRLPARERRLLALRFYGNHTQSQIAAELGISQMHVSRLLTRALTWLREAMLSDVPPPWEGSSEDLDHRLHLQVTAAAGVVTVRVRGEVDRDNAEQLRRALLDATGARAVEQLVVDFTAMPLIDAAGIGVLLAVHEAARVRNTNVRVVGLQPHVAHIVAVSGLGSLLD